MIFAIALHRYQGHGRAVASSFSLKRLTSKNLKNARKAAIEKNMPRNISSALRAHLQQEVTTLATCVKLTRRDGVTLGFTSADHDLLMDSLTYKAVDGLDQSAIHTASGTGVDNLDVAGVLSDDRITEADILAGRYDGAEVTFSRVNWADLSMGGLILFRGRFGEITLREGQFQVELRSLTQMLKATVGEVTSPLCRCRHLGDSRCKVDAGSYRFSVSIASVVSATRILVSGDDHASGYFDEGLIALSSGPNADLTREIKTHVLADGLAQLDLHRPFPLSVSVADDATLEAGCDRRFATCRDKFSNSINFRGEPLLPGNDQVFRVARPPA